MKTFFGLLALLGAVLFFSVQSHASILLEPHLGYNVSGGQSNYNGTKYDYTGAQLGARLGMQHLGVMGGFDFTHSNYTVNQTVLASQVKTTVDTKENDYGVFLGYNAPILVRGWVGYYFSTKATDGSNNYTKGKTTELGLGFTPLPLLSLNIMYRMTSYDTLYTASNNASSTLSPNYEPKEIVLGVSLPVTFL